MPGGGSLALGHLRVPVLDDAELDAVALRQGDPRLVALPDHKDVLQARREGVVGGVLHVHDLEGPWMPLAVHDDAHAANVVPAADHDDVACFKLDVVEHLAGGNVNTDRVVDLDVGVRVAQRSAVVGDSVGDPLGSLVDILDAAELVAGFVLADLVQDKASLGVEEQAEVLLGLLDLDHVHEASWVESVGADLAVHLDEALHDDHLALAVCQRILQPLPQHDNEG
mmetsp:Transcript_69347/g.216499  ORF Transcript_69347/g.216499 Transcript_69347/m.216499 type:complete len:225 (-) Transcript_69347:212-886(-)